MIEPVFTGQVSGGVQKKFWFPNNYGASVVRHQFSYGHEDGKWELAVLHGQGPEDSELCYSTPVTNDVLGWLDDNDVQRILKEIQELPANDRCDHGRGFPLDPETMGEKEHEPTVAQALNSALSQLRSVPFPQLEDEDEGPPRGLSTGMTSFEVDPDALERAYDESREDEDD